MREKESRLRGDQSSSRAQARIRACSGRARPRRPFSPSPWSLAVPAQAAPRPTIGQVEARVNAPERPGRGGEREAQRAQRAGRRRPTPASRKVRKRIADQTAALNEVRGQLGVFAAAAYRSGGVDSTIQLMLSDDPVQLPRPVVLARRRRPRPAGDDAPRRRRAAAARPVQGRARPDPRRPAQASPTRPPSRAARSTPRPPRPSACSNSLRADERRKLAAAQAARAAAAQRASRAALRASTRRRRRLVASSSSSSLVRSSRVLRSGLGSRRRRRRLRPRPGRQALHLGRLGPELVRLLRSHHARLGRRPASRCRTTRTRSTRRPATSRAATCSPVT